MMGPEHLGELRRAVEALEAVIGVRIQERKAPGGPLGRRLGMDGPDEGIPPLSTYSGTGPLAEAVGIAGLRPEDALILVAAIAPYVDEKFEVLYGLLTDRQGSGGLTGPVARTLAARTFGGRLAVMSRLSSSAPLIATSMLSFDPPGDPDGRLIPDPGLVSWLLDRPVESASTSVGFPARPLHTVHDLDDVVLPGPVRNRLTELVDRIRFRDQVVESWGFARHHDNVSGLVALFHGPSGTGKTMTAAAIARSVQMPAYLVDLSALVSKYIGETEKQLARVFERAARERCVLVFDEADAVFGKRTDVSDSHDRYANQEVSYLLARIESHPGVVILTTNLLANIDEAFQRRIHVVVEFPMPGVGERVELWKKAIPPELPVSVDVDLAILAESYEITGAQIRDATVDAAYLAASNGQVVTSDYLVTGIRRQYEKAGRTVPR